MHILTIDGLKVPNVSDEAKAAIEKLQGQIGTLTTAKDAAETSVATLTTDKATLEAKVTTLEQQVKDAEVTPARLQELADERAKVIAAAQSVKPGIVVDGKTIAEIQKDAVTAKLGDVAKDWTDVQIAASFATLTKDVKPGSGTVVVPIHSPAHVADTSTVRDAARAARYAG